MAASGQAGQRMAAGERPEGAVSPNGRIAGCYLHGVFAADPFRHAFLNRLRPRLRTELAFEAEVDRILDALAQHLEGHVDVDLLLNIANG